MSIREIFAHINSYDDLFALDIIQLAILIFERELGIRGRRPRFEKPLTYVNGQGMEITTHIATNKRENRIGSTMLVKIAIITKIASGTRTIVDKFA